MSDASGPSGFRFVFTVTENEDKAFRSLLAKNLWPLFNRSLSRGILLLGFAILYVATWIAFIRDWLPLSAVVLSSLSFLTGYWTAFLAYLRTQNRLNDMLFERSRDGQMTWQLIFDDTLVIVRRGDVESRMPWSAISAVQDAESVVAFWFDVRWGFFIPARAFADRAFRATFTEWAAERVRSAAASSGAAVGPHVSLQPE